MVECLRGKSVTELVTTSAMFPVHTVWQPVIDIALGESSILPVDPLSRFSTYNLDLDIRAPGFHFKMIMFGFQYSCGRFPSS